LKSPKFKSCTALPLLEPTTTSTVMLSDFTEDMEFEPFVSSESNWDLSQDLSLLNEAIVTGSEEVMLTLSVSSFVGFI
jgi:hypothetical protein